MRLNKEIEDRILDKVIATVNKINNHYHTNLKVPVIHYDITGSTAGYAKYPAMTMHLNPKILLSNLEDSITNTIPHEICHLGVFQLCKEKGRKFPSAHGAEWKFMMLIVGASAKRCHSYDVSDLKKSMAEYHYLCKCTKGVTVSKIMHNKIQKGSLRACTKCGTLLKEWSKVLKHSFSKPSPNGTTKTRDDNESDI